MEYEDENEYNEVHTGTGKILVLFLGLVMVCAVFFGLGYSMGKNAAKSGGSVIPSTQASGEEASKPSPAVPAETASNCPAGQDCTAAAGSDQMTFYKSVEQKDSNPQLAAPAANPAPASAAPPAAPAPAASTSLTGYVVQVAAVTKQQDADALVDALHRKQYPAFVTKGTGDKLLHVQVGPFSDIKDAQAMKARLTADGYNPILKR